MNYVSLLAILSVAIVFVSGCTQTGQVTSLPKTGQEQQTQQVTCNKPYILVGTSCCLDQNDNSICDKDETIPESTPPQQSAQQETMPDKVNAMVSRVIDGDTIELQGNIEVRLLGINTLEEGQPYYQESTNRLKELVEGKIVVLESDVQDKDQYGRLLRYVFIDGVFANLQMLKEGYATVYIIRPNTKYEASLRNAENEAKALELNIWKQPAGENICDDRCIGVSYLKWNAEGSDCDNLNGEYVTFINSCFYPCDLTSWTVKDESSRDPYVFPVFVLESEKTISLYTGCGTNTETQLYWCASGYECNAIWNNDGDTLYMRNSKGELVLNYPYTGFA
jgi:micrococcal nuclease